VQDRKNKISSFSGRKTIEYNFNYQREQFLNNNIIKVRKCDTANERQDRYGKPTALPKGSARTCN
jgi:hypothetical protein